MNIFLLINWVLKNDSELSVYTILNNTKRSIYNMRNQIDKLFFNLKITLTRDYRDTRSYSHRTRTDLNRTRDKIVRKSYGNR